MDWVQRLNDTIAYIEAHLDGEIAYEELGRLACCSPYHYQRMFGYMAGVPLAEYIRRRRMSRAAEDLQAGDGKIVDLAAKYGYESPTAFNRAFQSVHGVAPSQARTKGQALRFFPVISFQITIKGAVEMEYRIEEKQAFRVVGVSVPLAAEVEKNFAAIPQAWGRVAQDGTLEKLAGKMEGAPAGVLGISLCGGEADTWKYIIGVASGQAADGFEEYVIPAYTFAVFPGAGPSAGIQDLERRIITEWLPASGYEYDNGPDVEVYLNPDPANAKYEVWIPVRKKA